VAGRNQRAGEAAKLWQEGDDSVPVLQSLGLFAVISPAIRTYYIRLSSFSKFKVAFVAEKNRGSGVELLTLAITARLV
jgi:hypothetical protein